MTQKTTLTEPALSALHFTKMTGTGNDFIIIDMRESSSVEFDRSLFSKSICRRNLSVGADGIVFIEKPVMSSSAFKWDFYNADGSAAEFCGNAARCVTRFAVEKKIAVSPFVFETKAGSVHVQILSSGSVRVEMPAPKIIQESVEVPVGEHLKTHVLYLNTGVPHVVKENDDWDQEYLFEMGNYLRNHELFKRTNGANATFYEVIGENKIHSATYERGVENVTLACGTGAVAAALAAFLGGMKSPIDVLVPGGLLKVELNDARTEVALIGEARFICEGRLRSEAFL